MRRVLSALSVVALLLLAGCGGDGPSTTASSPAGAATDASTAVAAEDLPDGVGALLEADVDDATFFGCVEIIRAGGGRRATRCNVKFGDLTRTFIHRGRGWAEE